jgi:acyl-CoA reductase-like NAD-dependent aldehyde dehydrogenase
MAVFGNAGQDCCARSRILVERPALEEFLSLLEPAVTGLRVGDPADERTQMGPLISAGQRETVASFVPEDTPVAIRGTAPDGPGWWYPPTVLTGVRPGDRAATEERDVGRALRVARALETGTLSVNSNTSVRVATPSAASSSPGSAASSAPTPWTTTPSH